MGDPTAKDVKGILSSVGVEADSKSLDVLINNLKGKSVSEVIADGQVLLADMPAGGGGGVSTAPATVVVEEVKPKEKTPEPSSDSDEDMGLGLFDILTILYLDSARNYSRAVFL